MEEDQETGEMGRIKKVTARKVSYYKAAKE